MENASKALIIAGAILLAILLISLGIIVYQQARGTITDSNLNDTEVQAFNTKVSQYCGNKKTANDMNGLIDAISSLNGAQNKVSKASRHLISVVVSGDTSSDYHTGGNVTVNETDKTVSTPKYPRFSNGPTYKAEYDVDADGYINKVTITITL